jgi:hypothetical protein
LALLQLKLGHFLNLNIFEEQTPLVKYASFNLPWHRDRPARGRVLAFLFLKKEGGGHFTLAARAIKACSPCCFYHKASILLHSGSRQARVATCREFRSVPKQLRQFLVTSVSMELPPTEPGHDIPAPPGLHPPAAAQAAGGNDILPNDAEIQTEVAETGCLTPGQIEMLVALRARIDGYPIDDAQDAHDDFVVWAKKFLALDLEKVARSIEALAAALPILDEFSAACKSELIVSEEGGTFPKWYGEVHDMEETLKAFYPVVDEIKSLDALQHFVVVVERPEPNAAAHLVKETDLDDVIGSLQASFNFVMTDLAKRVALKEIHRPPESHSPFLQYL